MEAPIVDAAHSPYPEWCEVAPSAPLRQGDVLAAVHRENDAWRRLIVIITADCDLAKSKHGGAITCVPLLTAHEYLMRFRYEGYRENLLDQLKAACLSSYRKAAGQESREISPSRLSEWVVEEDPERIVHELGIAGETSARFVTLARLIRMLTAQSPLNIREAGRMIAECRVALNSNGDLDRMAGEVAGNMARILEELPGDALFIDQLSSVHQRGYVAYLRRVVEVAEGAARTTMIPSEDTAGEQYVRISRLTSPYVFALTQQFGAVFSAIGLPSSYETARSARAAHLAIGGQ